MLAPRRKWQRAVPPVALPPPLRAQLLRPTWPLADVFAREEVFASYRPKLAIALAEDHAAVAGKTNRFYSVPEPLAAAGTRVRNTFADALAHTKSQHRELGKAQLTKAFDEQSIRDYAENYAHLCSQAGSLERRECFARSVGVDPPSARGITSAGKVGRLDDPQWWRRQLRATWNRRAENQFRVMGIVRKGREAYASDDAVQARTMQKARCASFMQSHAATNQLGEQLNLLELAEKSLANPALRRGELMCRVRGFEETSLKEGHVGQFWTLTTPSKYHAYLHTGEKNPNYQGATVRDGQGWLCKQWARARAKLKRLSIIVYGVRVAEPHHDGTPHWHLLLFVRHHDAETVERVIRGFWLKESPDEPGAREVRVKCKAIDPEQGSAVGYIAKYVSKNIDGAGAMAGELDDETARPVPESLRRVDAWASLHRIRQFQQIGGPPVGLWRELRRLREPVEPQVVEAVRAPASDISSWSDFIGTLGGLERAARRVGCVAERFSRTLTHIPKVRVRRLAKRQWSKKCGPRVAWESRPATEAEMPAAWLDRAAPRAVDRAGREVICANKYGETPAYRAAGIVSYGLLGRFQSAATRPYIWRIQKCLTKNFARSVMNPPAPAALGSEAGNRNKPHWHDETPGSLQRACADGVGEPGVDRPSVPPSFFYFRDRVLSGLGPVAITVRESDPRDFSWIATIPYRVAKPGGSSGGS